MEQRQQDCEAAPLFRMHEALTPELLREIYSENQLPIVNPFVALFEGIKKWCKTQFVAR
jgi:hypothetical protein